MTKKISELSPAGVLLGAEEIPIVQGGATVRTTLGDVLAPCVRSVGTQTITGNKIFTDLPTVPDGSFTIAKTVGLQTALNNAAVGGGAAATAATLADWTLAEAFRMATATYDSNGVLSTASVVWPDSSTGTLTVTATTVAVKGIDAYHITHDLSGKTVTQPAVTRDANGNVTAEPSLLITP